MNTDPTIPKNPQHPQVFHIPVLSREIIAALDIKPGGRYLDATVGGGGHSQLILEAAPDIQLVAIDQDEWAIATSQERLRDYSRQIQFWRGNFADYNPKELCFDGVVADLGVNSTQFDSPERGFSFRHAAPLDMRMDQRQSLTASEIINHWQEAELANIFYAYGEERLSRRIAHRIVEKRPFQSTTELAEVIFHSVPRQYRYGRIHPATRVFQALRIVVNQELKSLELFLENVSSWLNPGGILCVISFHSLEDRMVKHALRADSNLQVLTKKPILPQPDELDQNIRSRSAKLRIASRICEAD